MDRQTAEACVDAIFEDLRDRRFLKWLFNADGLDAGPILHDRSGAPLMPLDSEVQADIREFWIGILMSTASKAEGA